MVGLIALAFNLRPVAVSVGPVLPELRSGLSMSATTAGVVTTLPVLCFAFFALLAPWAARTIGIHKVLLGSLTLAALALFARAGAPNAVVFICATVPALAGMATANVLCRLWSSATSRTGSASSRRSTARPLLSG